MGASVSFQFRNEAFSARSRNSRDCAEAHMCTSHPVAAGQIDAKIAEKGHFWIETSYKLRFRMSNTSPVPTGFSCC
jgi:hypothetical protein